MLWCRLCPAWKVDCSTPPDWTHRFTCYSGGQTASAGRRRGRRREEVLTRHRAGLDGVLRLLDRDEPRQVLQRVLSLEALAGLPVDGVQAVVREVVPHHPREQAAGVAPLVEVTRELLKLVLGVRDVAAAADHDRHQPLEGRGVDRRVGLVQRRDKRAAAQRRSGAGRLAVLAHVAGRRHVDQDLLDGVELLLGDLRADPALVEALADLVLHASLQRDDVTLPAVAVVRDVVAPVEDAQHDAADDHDRDGRDDQPHVLLDEFHQISP